MEDDDEDDGEGEDDEDEMEVVGEAVESSRSALPQDESRNSEGVARAEGRALVHTGSVDICEQQNAFMREFRKQLAGDGDCTVLSVSQTWGDLPALCTQYHEELDAEPYDRTPTWRTSLPAVHRLYLQNVHPKLVHKLFIHCEFPKLNSLNLDYDIAGQPERTELLSVLLDAGRHLLPLLSTFHTENELHCPDWDVLKRFYVAIANVTEFTLQYWADSYNCPEWFDVLKEQWEYVRDHPWAHLQPYLPRLRLLVSHGPTGEKLRALLKLRKIINFPIREVYYVRGYILQYEIDHLGDQLDYFECDEEPTDELEHFNMLMRAVRSQPLVPP
ncbi:uncharacterized protein C8Q71DRAFT_737575 [Rhodofomes roseus]|uniref:Uncharacterized protein n=1 Tax=Rhodofomes roseus TaxID=34475 RepID=A0ABQ8KSI7_9APHY|nr:uncharacterized protein C8Q71DRAFT_737575 [Rhodofomes roseus]KAH9841545.1 hypothetical protein C8Q71DRAFT_737575 [Rhodofomes roseus]